MSGQGHYALKSTKPRPTPSFSFEFLVLYGCKIEIRTPLGA